MKLWTLSRRVTSQELPSGGVKCLMFSNISGKQKLWDESFWIDRQMQQNQEEDKHIPHLCLNKKQANRNRKYLPGLTHSLRSDASSRGNNHRVWIPSPGGARPPHSVCTTHSHCLCHVVVSCKEMVYFSSNHQF